MGWSHTSAAGRTMDRLERACRKASGGSQNRFPADDGWYFFEVDRIEHDDGRVTGYVCREAGDRCRAYSHLEITPDGRLLGGHEWMRDALKGA